MADIEKAFTYLHDNIPQWFVNVAEIEGKIVVLQDELAKAPTSTSVPKKRKSGSVESIRDLDDVVQEHGMCGARRSSPLATRKQRTPSVSSECIPFPATRRSRTMIVVSYDGQIQNSFEQLVRAIGTGRNMLRKGKMVAKMNAMAALASSDDDSDDDAVMSRIGSRRLQALSSVRTRVAKAQSGVTDSSSTPVEIFDSTDKALESAQSLCETAAHLALREGDCRKELESVRRHFEEAHEAARKEVARFAARKQKEEQEAAQKVQQDPEVEALPAPALEAKPLPPAEVTPMVHSTHIMSKVMDIEIDENEDDDDMSFVMPPVRLMSRV